MLIYSIYTKNGRYAPLAIKLSTLSDLLSRLCSVNLLELSSISISVDFDLLLLPIFSTLRNLLLSSLIAPNDSRLFVVSIVFITIDMASEFKVIVVKFTSV